MEYANFELYLHEAVVMLLGEKYVELPSGWLCGRSPVVLRRAAEAAASVPPPPNGIQSLLQRGTWAQDGSFQKVPRAVGTALSCRSSGSIGTPPSETEFESGWSCMKPGVGVSDLWGSLPTQDVLGFNESENPLPTFSSDTPIHHKLDHCMSCLSTKQSMTQASLKTQLVCGSFSDITLSCLSNDLHASNEKDQLCFSTKKSLIPIASVYQRHVFSFFWLICFGNQRSQISCFWGAHGDILSSVG